MVNDRDLMELMSMTATGVRLAGEKELPAGTKLFVVVWKEGSPHMGAYSHGGDQREMARVLHALLDQATKLIDRGPGGMGHVH
jgi:hypothetical protein